MNTEVLSAISAEAEVKRYTLVGDDICVKKYTNNAIPDWYKDLINDIVATDPSITNINDSINLLTLQGTGYHQSISILNTATESINASLTTLTNQVNNNTADIGKLNVTKVDAKQASAIALDVVASTFGKDGIANAWFSNQISTYASETQTNAMNISTLSAALNSHIALIDTAPQQVVDAVNSENTPAINGDKIATGSITADQIATNSIKAISLDANALNGKVIVGGTIQGSQIIGAVIKASWIDLSNQGILTNWKYFTESNPPPTEYLANFAHNTDGTLVTDSDGYYRLPSTNPVHSIPTETPEVAFYIEHTNKPVYYQIDNIHSSSSYDQPASNRCITSIGEACVLNCTATQPLLHVYAAYQDISNNASSALILNGITYTLTNASVTSSDNLNVSLTGGILYTDEDRLITEFDHDNIHFEVEKRRVTINSNEIVYHTTLKIKAGMHYITLRQIEPFIKSAYPVYFTLQ